MHNYIQKANMHERLSIKPEKEKGFLWKFINRKHFEKTFGIKHTDESAQEKVYVRFKQLSVIGSSALTNVDPADRDRVLNWGLGEIIKASDLAEGFGFSIVKPSKQEELKKA